MYKLTIVKNETTVFIRTDERFIARRVRQRTAQKATVETNWSPRHGRFHVGFVELFVDEPTIHMHRVLRKQVMDYIRSI